MAIAVSLGGPVHGQTDDANADIECLALTIFHEARGEPESGRLAVAHVVINRTHDARFPHGICDVVWQDNSKFGDACQFTWTCDKLSDQPTNARAWRESQVLATRVYNDLTQDPAAGALWYHADYVNPDWSPGPESGLVIGRHIFFDKTNDISGVAETGPGGKLLHGPDRRTMAFLKRALLSDEPVGGELTIGVGYQGHNPRRRAATINDMVFYQGDTVAPGIVVESILPGGVMFNCYDGQIRKLLVKSSPSLGRDRLARSG